MTSTSLRIAVLMRPIDHTDRWVTTVVTDAHADLLGAATFHQAIASATDTLNTLITHRHPIPDTVEVWTVMGTTDVLDRYEHHGARELFKLLPKVPAELIDISHRVITVHQDQLSA